MPVLKIKKADGTWQEVWGALGTGGSGGASTPKLTSVTMLAANWSGNDNLWSQVVTCGGVNVNSKLDPQPTPEQIVELQEAETALMFTNDQGIVKAWALWNKPTEDYTIDVLITEVALI